MRSPAIALIVALLIGAAIGHQLDLWHAAYHDGEDRLRLRCQKASPEVREYLNCGD